MTAPHDNAEVKAAEALLHEQQRQGGRTVPGLDGRTTGSKGYAFSQRVRKRIEECFGSLHTIGGTKKVQVRGREKVEMTFVVAGCALNLLRIAKLAPPAMGAVRA